MTRRVLVLIAVLPIILLACSNPKDSDAYKQLVVDVGALESERDSLQQQVTAIEDLSAKVEDLSAKVEDLKNQDRQIREKIGKLFEDPQLRQLSIKQFLEPACLAWNVAFLNSIGVTDDFKEQPKFADNKIGLAASSWYNAGNSHGWGIGASTAYDQGFFGSDDPPSTKMFARDAYRPKMECSTVASDKWYKEICETFDSRFMKKNPDNFKGKCLRGTVKIAQMDSSTGPCSFHGYLNGNYDFRTQFGTTLDVDKQSTVTNCNDMKDFVEGKYIKFWAFGLGSYNYNTTSGGNQTIPAFKLAFWR